MSYARGPVQIVLNADDFGYSTDTVQATIACFERGLLTSATIMPGMPSSDAAIDYARSRPDLSFGVHLTFTGSGLERPLAEPAHVPGLVDGDGRFRGGRDIRLRALLRRLDATEIDAEMKAQIGAVVQEEHGLVFEPGNEFSYNGKNDLGTCDFDGDGVNDSFMATGQSWWYRSGGTGPWEFLNPSTKKLSEVSIGHFDNDNRCDVKVDGIVHPGGRPPRPWALPTGPVVPITPGLLGN